MQQGTTVFDLKGDARRLRDALAEMKLPVTHTDALNLIARSRGERNWETLEATLTEQAKAVQTVTASSDQAEAKRKQWLNWLEAALILHGRTEEDLDDLVHEALPADEAATVNNNGMYDQLGALLTWHSTPAGRYANPRYNLAKQLAEAFDIKLEESTIRAQVSICAGSTFERSTTVDCLEWFANQDIATIVRLIEAGLHNTHISDEVVLWLEENSTNEVLRTELQALLSLMRTACNADTSPTSNIVGLTVDIDRADVLKYVTALGSAEDIGIDKRILEDLAGW